MHSAGFSFKREARNFFFFSSFVLSAQNIDLKKKKKSRATSSPASATAPRRSVLVRAVEPPKADAKPGLELAKSGNSFAAVKDIEAIQEVLPHR